MLKRRHHWLILPEGPVSAEVWQFLCRMRAGRHGRRAGARAQKRARHAAWRPISRNLDWESDYPERLIGS